MKKLLVCLLNYLCSIAFWGSMLQYIMLYYLFIPVGFNLYSKDEFRYIIIYNLFNLTLVIIRGIIHLGLKKKNTIFFTIICMPYLFISFYYCFEIIIAIAQNIINDNLIFQYSIIYFVPFLYILGIVISEIICKKDSLKAKNRLKYW